MKSFTQDPTEWMIEVERWHMQLGQLKETYQLDDLQLKTHIVSYLPEEYEPLKVKFNRALNKYKLEEFQDEIYEFWKMKKGNGSSSKSEKNETSTALTFASFGRKCNKCGQKGHKAKDCPKKKAGGTKEADGSKTRYHEGSQVLQLQQHGALC